MILLLIPASDAPTQDDVVSLIAFSSVPGIGYNTMRAPFSEHKGHLAAVRSLAPAELRRLDQ